MISSFISDPGIICFQHCTSKVFCFNLPDVCPTCNSKFDEKILKLLPFRLPYPFIRATQHPCSIVLRPTSGDFLNDYNNSKDLHIAVTTSKSTIIEFDRNGLQRHSLLDKSKNCNNDFNNSSLCWSQCLLVENVPEPWHELWDNVLTQICKQSRWSVKHYNEETYNCYTFVLTFLQALCYDRLSQAAQSKTVFCEKYIVPRTTTAGKYISLYRKIRDHKLYVHPIKDAKKNDSSTVIVSNSGSGSKSASNSSSSSSSSDTNSNNNNNNSIRGNLICKLFTIQE